jgi:hypothetical protein
VHNDSIFVAAVESGYVVAYCKDDQRRVAIPDGVQDRYSQKATRKNERRVPELEILVNLFLLGTDQMSNITLAAVNDEPTALEVVAAVKDMGVDERQLHRIDAAMTAQPHATSTCERVGGPQPSHSGGSEGQGIDD